MQSDEDLKRLAEKPQLDLADWIEITGIDDDLTGEKTRYVIDVEGVRFAGWPKDMIQAAPHEWRAEMWRDNNVQQLHFPCAPQALIDFVDADPAGLGCLSVPDIFRDAVKALKAEITPEKDELVKAKGGRPPSIPRKAEMLRYLITTMEQASGQSFDPALLPGTAVDLQDACERIEKAKTGEVKALKLKGSTGTFKEWLRAAGYGFPAGAPPKDKTKFWTRLCVETMGKIDAGVFHEDQHGKTLPLPPARDLCHP